MFADFLLLTVIIQNFIVVCAWLIGLVLLGKLDKN